jgi:ParB family transcriptional regulator, chromosome partitioning protein
MPPKAKPTVSIQLEYFPISALALSPLNARQTVPDDEITSMANSIAITGLLQNLIGLRDEAGDVLIVGGGKRLRALQQLAREGFVPGAGRVFDPVPVFVCETESDAIRASSVENEARRAPHPADCITTYGTQARAGATISDIAIANATSEAQVRRYLALSNLPTAAIEALRANKLSLDQAKALTLAPTPDAAEALLPTIITEGWHTGRIRSAFVQDMIPSTDKRVAFVGLQSYLDAGGECQRDLFSDDAYLSNAGLLDELALALSETIIANCKADGWKWAEYRPDWNKWDSVKGAEQLPRTPVELPPGDQARLDELYDIEHNAKTDLDRAEIRQLRERAAGDWTDEQRATAGVIIHLGRTGAEFSRGWQRHTDRPAAPETTPGDDTITTTRLPAADAAPSQSLADDLARIRLLSLQNALLDQPTLLLSALAFQITHPHHAYDAALAITTNAPNNTPERPDGTTISTRLQDPMRVHAVTDPAAFVAFCALPLNEQLETLGTALARFIRPGAAIEYLLAAASKPEPRTVWHPTQAGYLARLKSAQLDAIWAQLVPDEEHLKDETAAFHTMKAKGKAAHLDRLFNDLSLREALGLSRDQNAKIDAWLPPELIWDIAPDLILDEDAIDEGDSEFEDEVAA